MLNFKARIAVDFRLKNRENMMPLAPSSETHD